MNPWEMWTTDDWVRHYGVVAPLASHGAGESFGDGLKRTLSTAEQDAKRFASDVASSPTKLAVAAGIAVVALLALQGRKS